MRQKHKGGQQTIQRNRSKNFKAFETLERFGFMALRLGLDNNGEEANSMRYRKQAFERFRNK